MGLSALRKLYSQAVTCPLRRILVGGNWLYDSSVLPWTETVTLWMKRWLTWIAAFTLHILFVSYFWHILEHLKISRTWGKVTFAWFTRMRPVCYAWFCPWNSTTFSYSASIRVIYVHGTNGKHTSIIQTAYSAAMTSCLFLSGLIYYFF